MNTELADLFSSSIEKSKSSTPASKQVIFSNKDNNVPVDDVLSDSDVEAAPPKKKTVSIQEPVKEESAAKKLSNAELRISRKRALKSDDEEADVATPKKAKVTESPERLARTVFAGNVSLKACKKPLFTELKKLFLAFGKVESVRFRSVPFSSSNRPGERKRDFIKSQNISQERDSCNAYVVFETKEHALTAAKALNGTVFEGKHLRVDLCREELAEGEAKRNPTKRSIFIGNLAFDTTEEQLWTAFASCGDINNVRIIHDPKTNAGKGIAYVEFKERAAIPLAKKMNGKKLKERPMRVEKCVDASKVPIKKPVAVKKPEVKKNGGKHMNKNNTKPGKAPTGFKKVNAGSKKASGFKKVTGFRKSK